MKEGASEEGRKNRLRGRLWNPRSEVGGVCKSVLVFSHGAVGGEG